MGCLIQEIIPARSFLILLFSFCYKLLLQNFQLDEAYTALLWAQLLSLVQSCCCSLSFSTNCWEQVMLFLHCNVFKMLLPDCSAMHIIVHMRRQLATAQAAAMATSVESHPVQTVQYNVQRAAWQNTRIYHRFVHTLPKQKTMVSCARPLSSLWHQSQTYHRSFFSSWTVPL